MQASVSITDENGEPVSETRRSELAEALRNAGSLLVLGESRADSSDSGSLVKTQLFIGGIPEEEYCRLRSLARRPLTHADVPGEEMSQKVLAELLLREDGAIVFRDDELPCGYINQDGTVSWTRL